MDAGSTPALLKGCHYKPLPNPASYIRLLEVSEEDDGQHPKKLKCHLTAWKTRKAPPYHAISYTWGDESIVDTIVLDGEAIGSMGVRKNLLDVLRQLLFVNMTRYYWIDALSINQEGLDEKGQQVGMMGSIYRNAEQVLVCLGEYDDDAEYAMQAMFERYGSQPMYAQFHLASDYPQQLKAWDLNEPLHRDHAATYKKGPAFRKPLDIFRYTLSLAAVSRRPYFSRVWILQELLLAKQISLTCGNARIPLEAFQCEVFAAESDAHLITQSDSWSPDSTEVELSRDFELPAPFVKGVRSPQGKLNENCPALLRKQWKALGRNEKLGPNQIIPLFSHFECYDPRDRIYGALALTDMRMPKQITPDYTISAFELAIRMLQCGFQAYLTKPLITALRLDGESSEMQEAISNRRRPPNSREARIAAPRRGLRAGKLVFNTTGLQISNKNVTWQRRKQCYQITILSRPPMYVKYDVFVPFHAKEGDWITHHFLPVIYPGQDIEEDAERRYFDGLVLRQVGQRLIIVGRAQFEDTCPDLEGNGDKLVVFFDPVDYLVCVSLAGSSEIFQRADEGICSEPYSSFAEFTNNIFALKVKQKLLKLSHSVLGWES